MASKATLYGVRVAVVTAIFGVGFMCGTVSQKSANAQMGDLGGELLKKAAGSGGIVGSVTQLGTAIVEMQKEVDGLQKNIGVLKKVKASLGGG